MGGTQAALTSDPTQSVLATGRHGRYRRIGLPLVMGAGTDVVSNAIQRLRGGVVPVTSYTGKPFGDDTARADNARTLVGEGVPGAGVTGQLGSDPAPLRQIRLADPRLRFAELSSRSQSEQFRNRVLATSVPRHTRTYQRHDFIRAGTSPRSTMPTAAAFRRCEACRPWTPTG